MDSDFLTDTVIVYPPVLTSDDDAGSIQSDGTGVTFPAAVQQVSDTSEGPHRDILADVPLGELYRVVLFATDPGGVKVDQRIKWTAHLTSSGLVTYAAPRWLTAIKRQVDPGGGKSAYRVVCIEKG